MIKGVPREELLLGGEVLHILRPVAYALLRIRRTEESWTPVVVSFLMEISGSVFSAFPGGLFTISQANWIA